ncbi:hypothetical protein, partial [Vibrio vulnificus]|uniref:hypothetical protein n=1 Tax=Vibrio vulnificus TaxID=672 RepID=UPI00405802A0
ALCLITKNQWLWFFFVPSADWFYVCRQVGICERCLPDINSLALEVQRIASINLQASARLGRFAQSEISFKLLVVKA